MSLIDNPIDPRASFMSQANNKEFDYKINIHDS